MHEVAASTIIHAVNKFSERKTDDLVSPRTGEGLNQFVQKR